MSDPGPREAARTGASPPGEVARCGNELLGRRADPRTNTVVKAVLRSGLLLSLGLVAAGLVVQLSSGHDRAVGVQMFRLFAPGVLGERIIGLGVLVLALTPAGAIVSLVVRWATERDWRFFGIGILVAFVLGAAVAVGFSGS